MKMSCANISLWRQAQGSLPCLNTLNNNEHILQKKNPYFKTTSNLLCTSNKSLKSKRLFQEDIFKMTGETIDDQRHFTMEQQQQSDYERLRDQCLSAMSELENLRRRHAEILTRCEVEAQKADYFRQQHKGLSSKLDEQTKECQMLRAQHEQVSKDRNKYKQDYDEIVLLREQEMDQKEIDTAQTSNLQRENEDLKDLKASYDLLSTQHNQLQDENVRLKEQYDLLVSERDSLAIERNALKQQCASAISGFEKALRDRDEAARESIQVKNQCEMALHELEQAVKVKLQMSKDIIKLREERNSAYHEYKLVMSERDTVHQEIEKLHDDLGQTKDKAKKLNDDKEKVFLEKEGLRHEIKAVLADRDQAFNEVHVLKDRLQQALKDKESMAKKLEEQRQEYEMLKQERNAAKQERGEAIIHRDHILKECFEVKSLFAKMEAGEGNQIEGLKKQFDKLSTELTHAWKSAEVAQVRRDWTFSERDKVLRDLELMKERYSKVSREKLVTDEQIRLLTTERDNAQKRYNDLVQEVCNNNGLSKTLATAINKNHLVSSQDSAIDTEAPSYHIETIELERKSPTDDFGFRIGGGNDAPLRPHDTSIFITEVIHDSLADEKLKVNDCIIRVNNIDLTNTEYQVARDAVFAGGNFLNVTILRQTKIGLKSPLQRIEIKSSEEKYIGLSIDSGLHIKRIDPGSAAAEEETLSIGDKILSVNGQSIENMSYEEAKKLLKTSNLSLTVLKPSVSTMSSRRSIPQIEDEKSLNSNDKSLNSQDKLFTTSPTIPSSNHFRSPSAPIYVSAAAASDHYTLDTNHTRQSSSVIGQMSDEDIKKILGELYAEEQRRQTSEQERKTSTISDEIKPHRNASFISAIKKDLSLVPISSASNFYTSDQTQYRRPISVHGSKQSVASSGSTGRHSHEFSKGHTPSSPLSISRDPLALSPRTIGQPSSATASTTSVNSSNRSVKPRGPRKPTSRNSYGPNSYTEPIHGRNVHKHLSEVFISQPYSFGNSLEKFGTFPGKPNRMFDPDRYSSLQNTSKPNSMRSVGHYKSCSSHGSLNSSEFSDRTPSILGNIEPVDEETDVGVEEFTLASSPPPPSPKPATLPQPTPLPKPLSHQSVPLLGQLSPKSPRSSGRSSKDKRQRSSSSPNHSHSRRSPKFNKSNKSLSYDEKPRITVIEKGQKPLGITITQGQNGGIFVAGVNEESIAAKVGLKYGDQLLDYNGINLRTASYDQAALILKQSAVENPVVTAQYNPNEMQENTDTAPSSAQSTPRTPHRTLPSSPLSTPILRRISRNGMPSTPKSIHVRINSNTSSCSDHSKITYNDIKITPIPEDDAVEPPRFIHIDREDPAAPLGIGIIGGNNIGIYISDIQQNSLAGTQPGLKCGDKILKYNGKDMSGNTLEEATLELGKPTEVADFEVQYNPPGYNEAQTESGDSIYVKTLYDRAHPPKGELAFHKDDILHVTETLYKGQLGVWRATIISDNPTESDEYKKIRGKIPSKGKAEQELLLRRSCAYGDDKLKGGRKSIFRRSKKGSSHHAINHSRESSDSKADVEIISTVSSGTSFAFNADDFIAYQYVKRYDSNYPRPVVIIGALVEPICDKLVMEYAQDFARCLPEINESTKDMMEVNIDNGTFVDYKLSRKGDRYECITPQAIKDVIYGKSKHCLLDINPEALQKLLSLKLHPIIIFIKYKSVKQIKEMKDGHYIKEKISSKSAKELYDAYTKLEKDLRLHITASLVCHSLNSICKEISEAVQEQQKKTLWINVD